MTAPEFDPGSVFDPVASLYQATRPEYPDRLFDSLERIVGPLERARVVDVGAGTGISTRSLAGRGARVVAVDPSLSMLTAARATPPQLPCTLGRAESLPVSTGWADLVTSAQAWHWVVLPDAAVECRRVLRSGGHLALWWNVSEDEGAFHDELAAECGIGRYGGRDRQDDDTALIDVSGFSEVRRDAVRWRWRVPLSHWLETVTTRSVLASQGDGGAAQLAAIEAVARRHFPGGVVTEWFTTRLAVATP